MLNLNENKLRKFILKNISYIFILIKIVSAGIFIDIKKLSISDNYFVVLDTGLYLYNLTNSDCALLHEFNDIEFRAFNNIINITELYNEHKAFILCLVNEYLFIFNEYNYKITNFKINEIIPFNNYYYNIIPYKIENNNISFFIAFNKDIDNLYFYFYNFNLNDGINEPKIIIFDEMNIQNKMIRCQINSNSIFIICFYYSKKDNKKYFSSTIFNIDKMNLYQQETLDIIEINKIDQIKLATSYNDRFFVCFSNTSIPSCIINNYNSLNEFKEIGCKYNGPWSSEYKVFYFRKAANFMLISRTFMLTTLLNNFDNSIKKCNQNIFRKQNDDYSLIYNDHFELINYSNFVNYLQCVDLSLLENNKNTEYKEIIKDLIDNSQNKEELLENLNTLIENSININYIDDNNELIIKKDEITITLTSTYIQKMKENSNSTTINFGKCEYDLKHIYNISEDSYLYILKLDKEQKGKNYPLIEYELFYPLNNEKIEILNLSFCEGTDIEISIPFKINDTIDKYNPKSNYFNDICSKTTSEFNTDITLKDRRNKFIKNNMSLCETNCELIDYDNNKKRAKCSCKVKKFLSLDNMELDSKNLINNFLDIKRITNIEIIKCFKTVFDKKNIKNNYGFFIIIFIMVLFYICLIVFYCKYLEKIICEFQNIIKAINDINNEDNQITINKPNDFINNNKVTTRKRKTVINKTSGQSSLKKINKKKKRNTNIFGINKSNKDKNEKYNNILIKTESELNSLSYEDALKKDKRTYCQYYISLLKKKQSILFSFYPNKDYNAQIIKSFLFFFFYILNLTVNALFFTDDTMNKIYTDSGSFNLNYQIPQIVYSCLISSVINLIIKYLSLSENAFI